MITVEVVSPSLSDYMEKVRNLASMYLGDADKWYDLSESILTDEDDRDEFSFIRMAVWDKLMKHEFFTFSSPPGQVGLFSQGGTEEPGTLPGSSFWGGEYWAHINMQSLLVAC